MMARSRLAVGLARAAALALVVPAPVAAQREWPKRVVAGASAEPSSEQRAFPFGPQFPGQKLELPAQRPEKSRALETWRGPPRQEPAGEKKAPQRAV